ncbi:MAG TPA: hypothetical protein VGA56_23150 [Opitutaceae bacterium]
MMKTRITEFARERLSSILSAALAALALGAVLPRTATAAQVEEFSEAQIFLEENHTDGDLGIQFFVDGDPWDRIILFNPWWQRLVDVKVKGSSGIIGLTELLSESAEPNFEDLPREDFLALFPEGEYKFLATTVEGPWLFGLADLTHTLPDPPKIIAPAEDGGPVDPSAPFVVKWAEYPADSVVSIHVVVEKDEEDERLRVLAADMNPEDTTLTVAPGFLEPGKAYKVEILAEEESGNKIISEVEFETSGEP